MAFETREIYLFKPVTSTNEITITMNHFLSDWKKHHCYSDNKILYHYTTFEGLKGILENRSIWLTHVRQLNDPLEIQYGKNIIIDLINEKIKDEKQAELRKFFDTMLVNINAFGEQLHHAFTFCFCEDIDLLSQWREYSERGGGYNIGFEFSQETQIALLANEFEGAKPPLLRKIIYDKELQVDIVNKYLDMIKECVSNLINKGEVPNGLADMSHYSSVMAMQAVNVLIDILLTFKHSAFKHESEWRLIFVSMASFQPENLNFRGKLIPYHIFNLYNLLKDGSMKFPIKSINFGPVLEPQKTRSSLKLYLHHVANNGNKIKIDPNIIQIKGTDYKLSI
jgi:hypothetical protein